MHDHTMQNYTNQLVDAAVRLRRAEVALECIDHDSQRDDWLAWFDETREARAHYENLCASDLYKKLHE